MTPADPRPALAGERQKVIVCGSRSWLMHVEIYSRLFKLPATSVQRLRQEVARLVTLCNEQEAEIEHRDSLAQSNALDRDAGL